MSLKESGLLPNAKRVTLWGAAHYVSTRTLARAASRQKESDMTKRTKTKAAQAASRVLDDSTPYAVWNTINVLSDVFGSKFLAKMRDDLTGYIEDSKTAAASALSQKEGK